MYGIIEQGSTGLPPSVPFEQPKNLYRYGEQTLWSTTFYAGNGAAAVNYANSTRRLFTTPLGQVGQGFTNALTIAETSLKEGGKVPAGIAYDVFGIACQIGQTSAVDDSGVLGQGIATTDDIRVLNEFLTNGILSWDFTQTQVDIAPILLIGAGGGAFGSVSVTGNGAIPNPSSTGSMNNGAGSVFLYRKHPVALPGNSTFSIILRLGSRMGALATGQNGFFAKVILMGYYKNVIEIG